MDETRSFAEMLEETLKTLNTGETVTGTVTRIEKDVVYVDVGVKATGLRHGARHHRRQGQGGGRAAHPPLL